MLSALRHPQSLHLQLCNGEDSQKFGISVVLGEVQGWEGPSLLPLAAPHVPQKHVQVFKLLFVCMD